jgi:hypothetical protein
MRVLRMFKITNLLGIAGVVGLVMGVVAFLQFASGGELSLLSSGVTNIIEGLILIGFARVIELLGAISSRLSEK